MGGSKSQITGYRYALGLHLALCHGPVDAIREIRVDGRTAWSVTTGGMEAGSGGAGVEPQIGTVAAMSAAPALPGEDDAQVTFAGTLPGVRLGQSYRLRLDDGSSAIITLRQVDYDAATDWTSWEVTPAETAFSAQPVVVLETSAAASNSGASAGGGRIRIDAPELFGGDSREGGIVGDVDVLMGAPDQAPNDYLARVLGAAVPAYRGLCSLVLRQMYLGLNPYLKPWAVRVTRVLAGEAGAPQWYPARAAIHPEASIANAAIHIALDASGSMSGLRMAAQKAAVATLLREIAASVDPDAPNDIRLQLWNSGVVAATEARDMDAAAYGVLEDWLLAQPDTTTGGTGFDAGFAGVSDFFAAAGEKRRVIVFITDGVPDPAGSVEAALATLASLPPADIFGVNVALEDTTQTARIDTTPVDGVPVIPPGDSAALIAALRGAFGAGPDMNPAHIIRDCLTNRDWGLGHPEAEIGESFTVAADVLHAEGFGLSLIWQQDSSIEDFIASVLDHIDATLFIDRRSGLWEMRLIRADYDASALPLVDETNVVDWGRLGRRAPGDLVNSVTVRFTDPRTDDTGAVSVTDTARVQAMGDVIATTLDYPGIRSQDLALRVAERDLRALSAPLLSGEIVVTRAGADLGPGDVIRLRSERLGLDDVVMRLSEIGQGDGRDNGIRLKLAEDVFALGATAIAGGRLGRGSAGLTSAPRPLERRLVIEAPYWLVVRELGHAEAERQLADDPEAGTLLTTAERPGADARAAQLWVDPGTGPVEEGAVAFAPTALLAEDLSAHPAHRVIAVTGWREIGAVAIGTLAAIGDEFVRVDGITPEALTLGRGCLDTAPRAHAAGTPVIFFGDVARIPESTWAAGETLAIRLLPETGRGTLAFARAPEDSVTLAARARRPLPPGNFRANGAFMPEALDGTPGFGDWPAGGSGGGGGSRGSGGAGAEPAVVWTGAPVTLSWAHRDRLTQTSPVIADHTAGDIGPEPGTNYRLRATALSETGADLGLVFEAAALVETALTVAGADLTAPLPPGTTALRWEVVSVRDGIDCRSAPRLVLPRPAPGLLRIGSPDELAAPAWVRIADGGPGVPGGRILISDEE